MSTINEIPPAELAELLGKGEVDLFDVRTPAEFGEAHAAAARSLPLDELDAARVQALRRTPAGPVYVICRSGGRGRQAYDKLRAAGCEVVNVAGGTQAWEQAGLEVVRGRKAVSLERQVRIAAGALVLLGAGLGLLHPAFNGLALFVGAGLVFAGVTDTCGMGLVLARMPWNRRPCRGGES
ncbi:MAG: rhodanese-like domain-containing protein [Gemmataceae bacterium]